MSGYDFLRSLQVSRDWQTYVPLGSIARPL